MATVLAGRKRRRLLLGATAVVVTVVAGGALAVATMALGERAGGEVRPGPAGSDATLVDMRDDSFQPTTIHVLLGVPATIEIRNVGEVDHNFTNANLNVSTGPMGPGDVVTVTFKPPTGTTEFHCTWHPEMVAQVVAG